MPLKVDSANVLAKFEMLERKAKNDLSNKALNEAAELLLTALRNNCQVDTGELQASLDKYGYKGGTNSSIKCGSTSDDIEIIKRAFYNEFGNSYQLGSHWMKKSWDETIQEASQLIKKIIIEELGL